MWLKRLMSISAARNLAQIQDHEPTTEEIAELLDKPIGEVKRMLGLNERIASVDTPWQGCRQALLDTIPIVKSRIRQRVFRMKG